METILSDVSIAITYSLQMADGIAIEHSYIDTLFWPVSEVLQREDPTESMGYGAAAVYAKSTMANRYVEIYRM